MRKLTEGEREVVEKSVNWLSPSAFKEVVETCGFILSNADILLRLALERKAIEDSGVLEDGARMADQLQLRIDLCKRCGPHSSGCMECSDNQATILTFRKALARLERKEA